jgi:hypothetical protein
MEASKYVLKLCSMIRNKVTKRKNFKSKKQSYECKVEVFVVVVVLNLQWCAFIL